MANCEACGMPLVGEGVRVMHWVNPARNMDVLLANSAPSDRVIEHDTALVCGDPCVERMRARWQNQALAYDLLDSTRADLAHGREHSLIAGELEHIIARHRAL